MVTQTMPGQLRELAGITLTEFDSSPVSTKLSNGFGEAKLWRDIIEPETAQTVVSYESEFYSGTPAVTVNEFGKGKVWYIGCDLEDDAIETIVKRITDDADAEYIPQPENVEIVKRSANGIEYLMLMNYSNEAKDTGIKGVSMISGNDFDGVLDAYGAEVIKL